MPSITESFRAHLEAKKAISDDLRNDAYKVRYSVYCVERGYEDQTKFPDRMERDQFDNESVHALVRHKKSKKPVGVVRLVLPNRRKPGRQFPIEMHFGHRFDASILNKFHFSRSNIAEVSRFAVSKQSLAKIQKQLAGEVNHKNYDLREKDPRLLLPHISLGLIAMLFAISDEQGIDYWYAAMEPSLSRLLTRLGIHFIPIGPVMNYHGKRQPMIAKVDDLLDNIAHTRKDFYRLITDVSGIPALKRHAAPAHAAQEVSGAKSNKAIAY